MEAFTKDEVVPDVVDSAPTSLLQVTYGSQSVSPGCVFTPTQVQAQPDVIYSPGEGEFYTLVMTDPDAPSRAKPSKREYLHWIVGNIPGSEIAKGEVLAEYIGAGPPKGTGLHRYVFLLYLQPGKTDFSDFGKITKTMSTGRPQFKVKEFAASHGFTELKSGTFFQAEYDDYCPILYKQLKS